MAAIAVIALRQLQQLLCGSYSNCFTTITAIAVRQLQQSQQLRYGNYSNCSTAATAITAIELRQLQQLFYSNFSNRCDFTAGRMGDSIARCNCCKTAVAVKL
jgi:hypothetical protein